jgi:hypothetical protein
MATPKLIAAEGPYEVYRAGHVLIVQRDGEFYCNLRQADRGFANPAAHIADMIRAEREAEQDRAIAAEARRERAAAYLAARADRRAAQPELF